MANSASSTTTGTRVRLLCVATLTPRKGHELLVRALSRLSQLDWHLTCVGSLDRDRADRLAAVITGMRALAHGAGRELDRGDLLQVLLVSTLTAFAISALGHAHRLAVLNVLERGSEICFGIMRLVVQLAPLGAFGAMAFTVGKMLDTIGRRWGTTLVCALMSLSCVGAWISREALPDPRAALALLGIGAVGYGLSLRLYLLAQRELGSARTGSVFAVGPFDATLEGADFAGRTLARLLAISSSVGLFALTTDPRSLVADLERRGAGPRLAFVALATALCQQPRRERLHDAVPDHPHRKEPAHSAMAPPQPVGEEHGQRHHEPDVTRPEQEEPRRRQTIDGRRLRQHRPQRWLLLRLADVLVEEQQQADEQHRQAARHRGAARSCPGGLTQVRLE